MKHFLLLPLLLLGTVSALHLENDVPSPESLETQAEQSQDPECSGEPEGEVALTEKVIQSEGELVKSSGPQHTFEDKEDMESDPERDEDVQCPLEEDTVQMPASPGCKTCRYLLVRTPRTFRKAQRTCRRCYRGNLISIHNYNFNYRIQCLTSGLNQGQVWIGGTLGGWLWCRRFRWTDGSSWNFGYWASGQPGSGRGNCVALCTRGGHWRRSNCKTRLPFVCSF